MNHLVRAWQISFRYVDRVTFSDSVRRQFGESNSEIRGSRGLSDESRSTLQEEGGWAQALTANNHPFAKVCDARVEIIFSTSVLGKVQEHVPLKTPEVTEQLELACIATSSPCIV